LKNAKTTSSQKLHKSAMHAVISLLLQKQSKLGCTELFFIEPEKRNGAYHRHASCAFGTQTAASNKQSVW